MKRQQLSVRLYGKSVGILEQLPTGKMKFTYENLQVPAISIGMPVRKEAYGAIQCEAFFGGLLPESDLAKKAIAQRHRISPHNSFALLKAIGYDCAGAISFHAIEETENTTNTYSLTGRIVSETELYQHIGDLPKNPLFMDVEDLRLSLAGVHDKGAICLIDQQIAFPTEGCPSTHIIKPSNKQFEGLVENEFFCLQLAKRLGLAVPHAEIHYIKDINYLLIERYDRVIEQNKVKRLHQEDFCQALGIVAIKKYQNEGGPGFNECFSLLNETIQPAIARNQLVNLLIYNFLIGNMDAHGKNFSLIHLAQDQLVLAPAYDLVSTQMYPALSKKMAMKIGNEYLADRVAANDFKQLCEKIGYAYPAFMRLIKHQAEKMLEELTTNKDFYLETTKEVPIIKQMIALITKQIKNLLAHRLLH